MERSQNGQKQLKILKCCILGMPNGQMTSFSLFSCFYEVMCAWKIHYYTFVKLTLLILNAALKKSITACINYRVLLFEDMKLELRNSLNLILNSVLPDAHLSEQSINQKSQKLFIILQCNNPFICSYLCWAIHFENCLLLGIFSI